MPVEWISMTTVEGEPLLLCVSSGVTVEPVPRKEGVCRIFCGSAVREVRMDIQSFALAVGATVMP